MTRDAKKQLDIVIDRAVKQSEARIDAKAADLREQLRKERAKLLKDLTLPQYETQA